MIGDIDKCFYYIICIILLLLLYAGFIGGFIGVGGVVFVGSGGAFIKLVAVVGSGVFGVNSGASGVAARVGFVGLGVGAAFVGFGGSGDYMCNGNIVL